MIVQRWNVRKSIYAGGARLIVAHLRAIFMSMILVSAVAGCSQGSNISTSSVQRSVPNEKAYVLPPAGGPAIVHVLERGYSNAIQQEISLATDSSVSGQNQFRVKIFGNLDPKEAGEG